MRSVTLVLVLTCFISVTVSAQVGDIKKKSSENANRRGWGSEGRNSGSSACSGCNVFFYVDVYRIVGEVQAATLAKRDSIKRIVSLETFFQGAVQPSNYYLFNPRIRGNWGLFSTDFRFNYLIEQNVGNGMHDLSTFDWQIVQLNLITRRNFTGRLGMGSLIESYGGSQSFFEWTAGASYFSNSQSLIANMEYRDAKDYNTNAIPRREINFSVEKMIFQSGHWHGYATLGGVYQRYYQSISVWGLQAGLAIRIF